MKNSFRKLLLWVVLAACGNVANAQLPNEKFGKLSSVEVGEWSLRNLNYQTR